MRHKLNKLLLNTGKALCLRIRVMEKQLDLNEITDWESFILFYDVLGFPDSYRRNMYAWIECMSHVDVSDADKSTRLNFIPA